MEDVKMSVREAAGILGMSEDHIRYLMRLDRLPIGHAVKGKGRSYRYLIFKPLLDAYIGRKEET